MGHPVVSKVRHGNTSDKITCTVGFVNCFLRVLLVYQPCCSKTCSLGKLGELSENRLQNLLYKVFCHLVHGPTVEINYHLRVKFSPALPKSFLWLLQERGGGDDGWME